MKTETDKQLDLGRNPSACLRWGALAMVLGLPWIVVNSDATVSMFLKFDDSTLKGEATDPGHKGEIKVLSFSVGGSNSGTTHIGGGAGAGTSNVQDMGLVKYIDISSPELLRRVMTGEL